jgi:hypothetical protein
VLRGLRGSVHRGMLSLTSAHPIRNLTPNMRPLTRTHGFVAAALLIIAIIAVLGHVCVLPVHAHMVPVEGHGSHGDDAPSDDSVHAASCDALKSTSATPSIVPATTSTLLLVVKPVLLRLFDTAAASTHTESPPLFLLHAALLI